MCYSVLRAMARCFVANLRRRCQNPKYIWHITQFCVTLRINAGMNVLIVNTSEKTGGAAIAANRLMHALTDNGVKVKMLVRDRQTQNMYVNAVPGVLRHKARFVWERFVIFARNRFSKKHLWDVDIANVGTDITRLPEFEWADVIHLHWVNQSFLSWSDIEKIVQSGKKVVWTLHDEWPFTGICHYTDGCDRYQSHCEDCQFLRGNTSKDISYFLFERKKALYQGINRVTFVGCSNWICERARTSALLKGRTTESQINGCISPCRVVHIPNTIDQTVFCPMDRCEARRKHGLPLDKKLLLFSSLKVTDKRKGIDYLVEACRQLHCTKPDLDDKIGIVVVGKNTQAIEGLFPYKLYGIDYVKDEALMAALYGAVDAFVTPSLQDNLPNTIVEAMSVGTPCVAFAVGGIPEMIHHKEDGYLATPPSQGLLADDSLDLAAGIVYVLDNANNKRLSEASAHFAAKTYNHSRIASLYADVYR